MRIFKPRFKGREGTYREATNYAMEFEAGGKRTVKSLQTPNRATAEARAKLLMAQTRDRGWEILKPRLPGARLMKIEDLCALYRLYATTKERPLSPFTIGKNICTFRRLAREMEVDSVEAMVGKVKEWRAAAMATKSPISIATDLRSAACVFTEEAKRYYVESGWAMVDPFDGVKVPQFEIKPFEGYACSPALGGWQSLGALCGRRQWRASLPMACLGEHRLGETNFAVSSHTIFSKIVSPTLLLVANETLGARLFCACGTPAVDH